MAKRKNKHQQKRDVVFVEMMQSYGGKSRPHKSKKDYCRKGKFHKGWQSDQPFLCALVIANSSLKLTFITCKLTFFALIPPTLKTSWQ